MKSLKVGLGQDLLERREEAEQAGKRNNGAEEIVQTLPAIWMMTKAGVTPLAQVSTTTTREHTTRMAVEEEALDSKCQI